MDSSSCYKTCPNFATTTTFARISQQLNDDFTHRSVLSLRLAIRRNMLNAVSPNPNPSGRGSSARQPISMSNFSMSSSYNSFSNSECFLFGVSFSKDSTGASLVNRLNSLYRGIPRSRSRKMSMVARSIV